VEEHGGPTAAVFGLVKSKLTAPAGRSAERDVVLATERVEVEAGIELDTGNSGREREESGEEEGSHCGEMRGGERGMWDGGWENECVVSRERRRNVLERYI
jgi:hypothetical protein